MTRSYSRLIFVFAVALSALPLWGQQFGATKQVNSIAAIVNSKIITAGMVYEQLRKNGPVNILSAPSAVLERQKEIARNNLIVQELVLQEYKEKQFSVPDSIFDQRIKENMQKNGFPTRESLIVDLRNKGKTYDEFAREQREQMIFNIMLSEFVSTKGIVISPRKIENYYIANKNQYRKDSEIKLRMITLANSKHLGPEATRRLADEIHTKLADAESFAQMAQIHSDDQHAREGGLRPGWESKSKPDKPGTLRKQLEQAAFSLGQGQVSPVIQLGGGCWIIRCEEIRQQELRSLADVRDEIEDVLKSVERNAREQRWFGKLQTKAHIERFQY